MSLVVRMKEGDKTPTLYTWYDKKYNFDDLQREADYGLEEYINTLKRGDKDEEKFRQAYYDIMSGIKDGSITFKDGRYIDSKGRYTNGTYYDQDGKQQSSKRKSKDYYGLMANYIYRLQSRGKEYTPPEDLSKIKWDGGAGTRTALMRSIFNSDKGNLQDFLDLDPYDENAKKRLTTNRAKELAKGFQNTITNFDSFFTEFEDADKAAYIENAKKAIQALNDGTIDSGDYLALSRAINGIDYRSLFSDQSQNDEEDLNEDEAPRTQVKFIDWVKQKYPRFTGPLRQPKSLVSNRTYGPEAIGTLERALSTTKDLDLYRILQMYLVDPKYVFNNEPLIAEAFKRRDFGFTNEFGIQKVLQALKNKGLLYSFDDGTGKYYIPRMNTNRQTSWIWDEPNNTLSEMSYHDIPYWRERILDEWRNQKSGLSEDNSYWTSRYGSFKKGGVIKATGGTSIEPDPLPNRAKGAYWYSGLADFDPSGYTYQYDTSRLVNADMTDDNFDPWVSNVAGKGDGRYLPSVGNTKDYTKGIEENPYYQQFGESLLDENGDFTEVGKAWAKAVDANLPSNSPASFYDANGNLRTSWSVNNNDIYGNKPHSFNKLADYVKYVRNDQILGSRHNVFLNTGKRYFYKDQDGKEHWVDPNSIDKYTVSESPTRSSWNNDHTVYWNDYELTGLKTPTGPKDEKDEKDSFIDPRSQSTKSPNQFGNFLSQLAPDLIGAGRLFGSLRTNNKVAETIRKSLTPVLKNTYELYSPVTGAFSEMQLRNSQAADVRRQASRPFTSDASIQLAGALDANRQATDLERQGFLADDAEIKRTKAEALRRQEDNIARRSEVANFNRASVNQTNRELAQLEGARLKQNWQSVDNFLAGLEGRVRQRLEADKERKTNFRLQTAQQDINDQYQEAVQKAQDAASKWQKDPANASKTLSEMPNYFPFLRELSRWRNANSLGAHANVYGYRYNNDYLNKSARDIGSKYGFYRNGGSLRPSTLHMINRILRNENNT